MKWLVDPLRKFVEFSGRSSRQEYWMWILSVWVLAFLASLLTLAVPSFEFLLGILALGTFLPGLAILVRRLHDTNKSGWWLLILLIPLVGSITLLVFLATAGTVGDNDYGSDPRLVSAPLPASPPSSERDSRPVDKESSGGENVPPATSPMRPVIKMTEQNPEQG